VLVVVFLVFSHFHRKRLEFSALDSGFDESKAQGSKFKVQRFNSKFAMTTDKAMVGGTDGRSSTKGRGSRALFVDSTSHIPGSYPPHQ
jgi:hypothetical protein